MASRRASLVSAAAAATVCPPMSGAQTGPAAGSGKLGAPTTILQLQRRTIEVNGKPASVFAIRQPEDTSGIIIEVGKRFFVHLEKNVDQPRLIDWHGLTPPWQRDGVPGILGPFRPVGRQSRPSCRPTRFWHSRKSHRAANIVNWLILRLKILHGGVRCQQD
jgi:hypothetical protein